MKWFTARKANPNATLRLFCLPYAGASGAVFRSWQDGLPQAVEVCPVELPGRWSRVDEPLVDQLGPLVEALVGALRAYLDIPFVLLGCSMGGLIAFEVARQLRRASLPMPEALFAVARRAPHLRPMRALEASSQLSDADLVRSLTQARLAVPAAVLDNPELRAALLPPLRADLRLLESYRFVTEPSLDCPIFAYGGDNDPGATVSELDAWATHTSARFARRVFAGDHFFFNTAAAEVLAAVRQDLERLSAPVA
jgi:medium-chain acyl-[acyl-carrier-protein] hydrolase